MSDRQPHTKLGFVPGRDDFPEDRFRRKSAIHRQSPSEEKAFFEEIRSAPSDDFPRLVYADWLEEHGDPRATLIRLQCELEQLPLNDPRRRELESESFLLLRDHLREWVSGVVFPPSWIANMPQNLRFHRGFLAEVFLTSTVFSRKVESLIGKNPDLKKLKLRVDGPLTEIGKRPELRHITHLTLTGELDDDRLAQLLVSPYLENLEHLSVAGTLIEDLGAKVIANSPQLANLRSLDLSNCHALNREGLELIVTSPNLRRVEALSLAKLDGSPFQLSLKQLRWLPRLKELNLAGAGLSNPHLEMLGNGKGPSGLRTLILDRNRFNAVLLTQVLSSEQTSSLETLSLANLRLSNEPCFWTPAVSGNLKNLTSLSLTGTDFTERDYHNFVRFEGLKRLERLWIGQWRVNYSLATLLEKPMPRLRELDLSGPDSCRSEWELLIENPSLGNLESLDLSQKQHPGDSSLLVSLAASPVLSQSLKELKLNRFQLEAAQLRGLSNTTGFAALRKLSLVESRGLDFAGLNELAAWPRLLQLDELNLSGCRLGLSGLEALLRIPTPTRPLGWNLMGNKIGNPGADRLMKFRRPHFRVLKVQSGNDLTPVKFNELKRHFGEDIVQ